MKNLICALILLIASPVSATTIVLTDGQKIETGNCSIMKDGFIECISQERTQRIPLKAVQKIIRNDGSVLDQSALSQLAKGQKNTAKSDIPSDETLALLYKEAVEYLRDVKRETDKNSFINAKEANIVVKCGTAFYARQTKPIELSPSESATMQYYDKQAEKFSAAISTKQQGITDVIAAQKSLFAKAMSKKVIWDATIRQEKLNITIEKVE